jgi:hypothetical protein
VIEPRSPTLSAVALVLALYSAQAARAQEPDESTWTVSPEAIEFARTAPLFQSNALLELTLSADFQTLKREDRGEAEPQRRDATLAFTTADGSALTLEINVEARGNWRRNPRNCAFPPLWIDLDRDDEALEGTVFEGQNRLKLVLPCRPGNGTYEEYVYEEYVVYPAYNALTDASFRARPARITIVDTSGDDDPFTANAFVIEHKDQLAARNEAVPIELAQLHPALAAQEEAALTEVFNYMIGMTDYSGAYMHNVEPIRRTDGKMVLVAYDFDWSGTVNARYASPDPSLPIRNVRQRTFQGICRQVDYASIFAHFIERREAVLGAVRDFPHLDEDRREEIVEYWEEFFEMAADSGRQERILRDCIPMPA